MSPEQTLSEIAALYQRRIKLAKELEAIDKSISCLVGINSDETHKPKKSMISPKDAKKLLGIM